MNRREREVLVLAALEPIWSGPHLMSEWTEQAKVVTTLTRLLDEAVADETRECAELVRQMASLQRVSVGTIGPELVRYADAILARIPSELAGEKETEGTT